MRFISFLFVLLALAALPGKAYSGQAADRHSVTVMPFTALDDGGEAWLGKALSDMVAQKLAGSAGYDVLERDKLQAFIKEMELQQAGFADAEAIKRLGGLAQVDSVIYGNYKKNGSSIELHLLQMDMKSQSIEQEAEASGSADSLSAVAGDLVENFLKKAGTTLSPDDLKKIHFTATDFTPAVQHFYQGMDDYDNGKYEDAFGEFAAAAKQDNRYFDARLWEGKMLEYTGQDEQAVLIYNKLHDDASALVEGRDALFFAAKLEEKSAPDAAAAAYKTLADLRPRIPEGLEADLRLAAVLEKQGKAAEAYAALQDIQDFRKEADKQLFQLASEEMHEKRSGFFATLRRMIGLVDEERHDFTPTNPALLAGLVDLQMRQSRFFNWDRSLQLYRGATLQMINLYRRAAIEQPGIAPPRGVFVVDPKNPVISEAHYGDTKSLFFEDEKILPKWSEKFYAAIIPAGYVAEGVTLQVSGRLPSPTDTTDYTLRVFGFPLMKNYYNNWLGTIYGQTPDMTTLRKEVAFHGRDQDTLVFQLIENSGMIRDWQVEFRLRKDDAPAPKAAVPDAAGDFEGAVQARLPLNEDIAAGVAEPQYIEQYGTKKRLALVSLTPQDLWAVVARGDVKTGGTDLWSSHSTDGKTWSPFAPMPVNSQSNDMAPQLVRGEDGKARLFWISNRRGLGWELWTSAADGDTWSEPRRIPLEKFVHYSPAETVGIADDLLDFAAIQDNKGRWLVAVASTASDGGIGILSSVDAEKWELAGKVDGRGRFFDPAFMQDGTGVFWLGAIDGNAEFHLKKSFDLKSWDNHEYGLGSYSRHWSMPGNGNYGSISQIVGFPVTLFDAGADGTGLLFSDTVTGLQYARFHPDTGEPSPDLVRDISLEPYAATKTGKDNWLIAAWQGDDIVLRRYHIFAFPDNPRNSAESPLYHETEKDADGNRWDRRIARTRYVMSDVTAVGAAPDARAWWGIETGVMSLKDDNFFVADVSMGFFDHQVTDIVPCGADTYFAARNSGKPLLGVMESDHPSYSMDKVNLAGASGGVTAISCSDGLLYVGTRGGDVVAVSAENIKYSLHMAESYPTAITRSGDALWAGTEAGGLYKLQGGKFIGEPFQKELGAVAVTGLAPAPRGGLWMATDGGGLYLRENGKWRQFTPADKSFPYFRVGKIISDDRGVWFMAGPYVKARGIGYFDGRAATVYSPPSHDIFDPIDFAEAPDGSIWLGSELSGIYRFLKVKQ